MLRRQLDHWTQAAAAAGLLDIGGGDRRLDLVLVDEIWGVGRAGAGDWE